jgi:hypothetical protein
MVAVDTGRFTVGVFQDLAWAERGVEALKKQGLAVESLSVLGKASPELTTFIDLHIGAPQSFEVKDLGPTVRSTAAALRAIPELPRPAGHDAARSDFKRMTAAFSTR